MTQRVIVGLFCCALMVFCVRGIWATQTDYPAAAGLIRSGPQGPAPDIGFTPSSGAAIDIYGNEIQPALGDYRVDDQGAIYERHAPDTAVLALAPPKT